MLYVLAVRDISIDEVNGIIRIDVVSQGREYREKNR